MQIEGNTKRITFFLLSSAAYLIANRGRFLSFIEDKSKIVPHFIFYKRQKSYICKKVSSIKDKIMATIIRQSYIDKIERFLGKETIIVLVGQRRVGKSCMMKMIRDRKISDSSNNIIYIDKEKREFDHIQTYQDLNEYIGQHFYSDKHNYILIDEIQDIKEFERSIRSYRTEPNTDIIITGSNARMLSNELSTIIGGRYKEIYIQSLSYNEFFAIPSSIG